MKRLLAAIGLLFLLLPGIARADEGWVINRYHANLEVKPSGILEVTESIDLDFGLLDKHGIYRDIPFAYQNKDGSTLYTEIDVTGVDQDGGQAKFEIIRNSANLRIKIGDADKTISGPHKYVIRYTVIGALSSYQGFDEIYWNTTGNGWDVPIKQATASVAIPGQPTQAACYQGVAGATETCNFSALGPTTTFSSRSLRSTEGMTIAVGFQKGLVPILIGKQPPSLIGELVKPTSLILFGLTAIAGTYYVLRRWYRGGRDLWWAKRSAVAEKMPEALKPIGAKGTVVAEYEPPDGLRPAEVGVLVDERADTKDVVATIIDLGVRGYLKIEEIPKKWRFGKTDYNLHKIEKDRTGLRKYESKLLNELFDGKATVKVSDLKDSFYTALASVKKMLYEEVETRGLFAKNPEKVRNNNYLFGFLISGAATALLVIGIANFSAQPKLAYLVTIGIGLEVIGLTWLLMAKAMPARTAHGHEMYLRARGYEKFINTAEKHRQRFHENENYFTQILPYAILFGATKKLADAMKQMGIQPSNTGAWYVGTHPFNVGDFGGSMSGFEKSLSSAMASSPSSSGSGGGGFSGGGGGGGGGGSW